MYSHYSPMLLISYFISYLFVVGSWPLPLLINSCVCIRFREDHKLEIWVKSTKQKGQ